MKGGDESVGIILYESEFPDLSVFGLSEILDRKKAEPLKGLIENFLTQLQGLAIDAKTPFLIPTKLSGMEQAINPILESLEINLVGSCIVISLDLSLSMIDGLIQGLSDPQVMQGTRFIRIGQLEEEKRPHVAIFGPYDPHIRIFLHGLDLRRVEGDDIGFTGLQHRQHLQLLFHDNANTFYSQSPRWKPNYHIEPIPVSEYQRQP